MVIRLSNQEKRTHANGSFFLLSEELLRFTRVLINFESCYQNLDPPKTNFCIRFRSVKSARNPPKTNFCIRFRSVNRAPPQTGAPPRQCSRVRFKDDQKCMFEGFALGVKPSQTINQISASSREVSETIPSQGVSTVVLSDLHPPHPARVPPPPPESPPAPI